MSHGSRQTSADPAAAAPSRGHRATGESEAVSLHQMEIAAGPFDRRLRIPVPFERDHVSARLSEGVLTITLARRSPQQQRGKIEGWQKDTG